MPFSKKKSGIAPYYHIQRVIKYSKYQYNISQKMISMITYPLTNLVFLTTSQFNVNIAQFQNIISET